MKNQAIDQLNVFGKNRTACIFIIDFDMDRPIVCSLLDAYRDGIQYSIPGYRNFIKSDYVAPLYILQKRYKFIPDFISFNKYLDAYNIVHKNFLKGNTFLTNLTFPTELDTELRLVDFFYNSNAKYKLLLRNQFCVFSPETFIKIADNRISSYPMKGTIDASIKNARKLLINDEKEFAEHITIVDLIRNDLSIVSSNVRVEKFRYITKVQNNLGGLLQASSKITGRLKNDWQEHLGDIIFNLLPAGSITGAPKRKTLEIIKNAEQYERGYYTGVFGIFDGKKVDSAVMIRFVEKSNEGLLYKSGGGLTVYSTPESEYQELKDKVYVPF